VTNQISSFRSFGFVGYPGNPWSDERCGAFVDAVRRAGHGVETFADRPGRPMGEPHYQARRVSWRVERARMAGWLRRLPLPTGIMACNDDRAQNVGEACKVAGLRVPDDIGIIGADDDELVCELAQPPLSSVAVNFERAGFEAARLLDEMMRDPRRSRTNDIVVEPTAVVPRQSTDVLFIDDMAVSRAVRFIRQGARRALSVDEVAQAAGLSRRMLERRFRAVVGRPVLREIRRVRVESICRMLRETAMSVSDIAFASGFTGVEHFARYFRQERRMTPLGYRRAQGLG
jgi:LacI family transcriptional regulator